ncbi:MAG: hypothetical protein WBL93_05810 [Lutisporaceae bacterium]
MQCKQIKNHTMKYFDGNISELEMEQLMRHIQKCTVCAEEFEVLREALFEIEDLPDIDPPADLTVNIMTEVYSQKQLQISPRQLICWFVGFVGLVLFTYNIIAFMILPMISGGASLLSLDSLFNVVFWAGNLIKDSIVTLAVSIGKLLVLRNIILKDYTILIFMWLIAFALVDLMLYRLMHGKDKKNDFVNLN